MASLNSGGNIPANRRVLPYAEREDLTTQDPNTANAPKPTKYVVVESPAIIDGIELRTAAATQTAGSDKYQIALFAEEKRRGQVWQLDRREHQ